MAGSLALEKTEMQSSRVPLPWEVETEGAVEEQVQALFKPAAGAAPQELFGTGFTYRHDWGNMHGQHVLNLNWGAVNPRWKATSSR